MNDAMPLRRILVALDQSAPSLCALETAAQLAAENDAELVGLFIEERQLHTLAALPVTRLVGAAGPSQLDPALMRRALKVQAAQARDALSRTAEARRLAWSFRIVEGDADAVLAEEARHCDLLALGRCSSPGAQRRHLGRIARQASRDVSCSLLLAPAPHRERRPVLVLYDGDERVLNAAGILARQQGRPLAPVVIDDGGNGTAARADACRQWCDGHEFTGASVRTLSPDRFTALLAQEEAGLLVAARNSPSLPASGQDALLEDLPIPVLLLRDESLG